MSGEQDRGRVDNNPLSRLLFVDTFRALVTFLGLGDTEDRAGDTGVFGLGDLEAATDPTSVCRLLMKYEHGFPNSQTTETHPRPLDLEVTRLSSIHSPSSLSITAPRSCLCFPFAAGQVAVGFPMNVKVGRVLDACL